MRLSNSSAIGCTVAFGMAAGAEAPESAATPLIDQRLSEDAARRVSRAQEQHVVRTIGHGVSYRRPRASSPCRRPKPDTASETPRSPGASCGTS